MSSRSNGRSGAAPQDLGNSGAQHHARPGVATRHSSSVADLSLSRTPHTSPGSPAHYSSAQQHSSPSATGNSGDEDESDAEQQTAPDPFSRPHNTFPSLLSRSLTALATGVPPMTEALENSENQSGGADFGGDGSYAKTTGENETALFAHWAVKAGGKSGIYGHPDHAETACLGWPGATKRGFATHEEAYDWMQGVSNEQEGKEDVSGEEACAIRLEDACLNAGTLRQKASAPQTRLTHHTATATDALISEQSILDGGYYGPSSSLLSMPTSAQRELAYSLSAVSADEKAPVPSMRTREQYVEEEAGSLDSSQPDPTPSPYTAATFLATNLPFNDSDIPFPSSAASSLPTNSDASSQSTAVPDAPDTVEKKLKGRGKGKGRNTSLGASQSGVHGGDSDEPPQPTPDAPPAAPKTRLSVASLKTEYINPVVQNVADLQRHANNAITSIKYEEGQRNRTRAAAASMENSIRNLEQEIVASKSREKALEGQVIDLANRLDASIKVQSTKNESKSKLKDVYKQLDAIRAEMALADDLRTLDIQCDLRLYQIERQMTRERLNRTLCVTLPPHLPLTMCKDGDDPRPIRGAVSDTVVYLRRLLPKSIGDSIDDAWPMDSNFDEPTKYNVVLYSSGSALQARKSWPLEGVLAGALSERPIPLFDYPRVYSVNAAKLMRELGYFVSVACLHPQGRKGWHHERYEMYLHLTQEESESTDNELVGYQQIKLLPAGTWDLGYYEQPEFKLSASHRLPAAEAARIAASARSGTLPIPTAPVPTPPAAAAT
ncbi:hypothetical protein P7C70_g9125, partial [Phenoliferia sp. Uapishka_3]